jgi:hypothetical protein
MKRRQRRHTPKSSVTPVEPPELPEARPMPHEASPGGIEGADPGWPGGSSNLGELLNPKPEGKTTYSTSDLTDVPRVEVIAQFLCDKCGQAFQTQALLNVHRRTAHRPHA